MTLGFYPKYQTKIQMKKENEKLFNTIIGLQSATPPPPPPLPPKKSIWGDKIPVFRKLTLRAKKFIQLVDINL